MTTTDPELLERLAEIEHQQWSHWATALLEAEPGLSSQRAARWRSLLVPYADLPEPEKESDRCWARRALATIDPGRIP